MRLPEVDLVEMGLLSQVVIPVGVGEGDVAPVPIVQLWTDREKPSGCHDTSGYGRENPGDGGSWGRCSRWDRTDAGADQDRPKVPWHGGSLARQNRGALDAHGGNE